MKTVGKHRIQFRARKGPRWRWGLELVARMCDVRRNSADAKANVLRDCSKFMVENGLNPDDSIDPSVVALVDAFLDTGNPLDAPAINYLDIAAADRSVKSHLRTFVRACQVRHVGRFGMVLNSYRTALGVTQKKIASTLGVPVPMVKGWLRPWTSSGFSVITPVQALELDDLLHADGVIVAGYAALSQHEAFRIERPVLDKILRLTTFGQTLRQARAGLCKRKLLRQVAAISGMSIAEGLLSRWECGIAKPCRDMQEAILAIDKICNAGGRLVQAWEDECPQVVAKSYKFPYSDWSERLRRQDKRIELCKTTNPERLPRTKGRGSDRWGEASRKRFRWFSERFFGRVLKLTDPEGKPRFTASTLSFSLMCQFEFVEHGLEFSGTLANLWRCYFPFIATDVETEEYWQGRLPTVRIESRRLGPGLVIESRKELTGINEQWSEQVRLTAERAKEYLSGRRGSRRPLNKKIIAALDAQVEMQNIVREIEAIADRMPLRTTTRRCAIKWRKLLKAALTCAGTFRPETVRLLGLGEILPVNESVRAEIPADKLKNRGQGGSQGGVHRTLSELPWLYKVLRGWLDHGRPFLMQRALARGERDSDCLLVAAETKRGRIAGSTICAKTLAQDIKSMLGYSPYGQRHLFATVAWLAGLTVEQIANAMQNTPLIAAKHYQHLTAAQRTARSQTVFEELLKAGG